VTIYRALPPAACCILVRLLASTVCSLQPRYITATRLQTFRHHAALCVPESHLNFPFDIRNVNIVDPITPWNNLGRSVTRKVLGVHPSRAVVAV
jgi:hypothetical protein